MDLIDRADLLRHFEEIARAVPKSIALNVFVEIKGYVNRMPRVDSGIKWHKVTKRPLTQEEKAYYEEIGNCVDETFGFEMPDDGQEILVATKWGVSTDTCWVDEVYGIGLENRGYWYGVLAWAEMPKYEDN